MSSEQIVKRESSEVARQPNVLEMIQQAITNKADVEVMRGLFELQKDFMKMQAEQVFHASMARLQARLPQINKYGQARNSKYARLEDIDLIARPLIAEEGFAVGLEEESYDAANKTTTFLMRFTHNQGHSEVKRKTFHIDIAAKNREGNSTRPAIQDDGSTTSYARRQLLKMWLNIIETDEDTDGESRTTISEQQALDITSLMQEVKADKAKFLAYMGVADVGEILSSDYRKAVSALERKRVQK